MCTNDDNIHLLPIVGYDDSEESSDVSEHNDSLEIISVVDEDENETIDTTKELLYTSLDQLQINGGHNDYSLRDSDADNHDFRRGAVENIRSSFNDVTNYDIPTSVINNHRRTLDDSSSESDLDASNHHPIEQHPSNSHTQSSLSYSSSTTTNDILSNVDPVEKKSKRKRRSWSVVEKMEAIAKFRLNQNKSLTSMELGCTPAQLRNWLKNEQKLADLAKMKKGKLF